MTLNPLYSFGNSCRSKAVAHSLMVEPSLRALGPLDCGRARRKTGTFCFALISLHVLILPLHIINIHYSHQTLLLLQFKLCDILSLSLNYVVPPSKSQTNCVAIPSCSPVCAVFPREKFVTETAHHAHLPVKFY